MTDSVYRFSLVAIALAFTAFFAIVVMPPLIKNPDILGALSAGFVNPYASGYSADTVACWFILGAWVLYEARKHSVRGGAYCLALGLFPGVAVGFAAYLLIRGRYIRDFRLADGDRSS